MQLTANAGNILDRDNIGRVHPTEKLDAGIHRLVDYLPVAQPPDSHRASAAIAFAAAFLRARRVFGEPEIVQQHRARRKIVDLDDPAIAKEADGMAHRRQLPR
jgi:hypothetical protein